MYGKLKYLVLGPPLPTRQLGDRRLNKVRALAAFSPDALSSIAHANQEIYPVTPTTCANRHTGCHCSIC
jgi:hypothetical protein